MTHELLIETLGEEVWRHLHRSANRLQSATGGQNPFRLSETVEVQTWYREALTGKLGAPSGDLAARRVVDYVIEPYELDLPDFWMTGLGRAVAWWIGAHKPYVSRAVAAAVLGCSRQNVHKLARTGALEISEDGLEDLITSESLRAELRRRYPLEQAA
jgi:hypothetical protein